MSQCRGLTRDCDGERTERCRLGATIGGYCKLHAPAMTARTDEEIACDVSKIEYVRHVLRRIEMSPVEMLLRYFKYDHLPSQLQAVSKPFCELAEQIAGAGTIGPETTTGLRKLLEAKDCIVRAHLHEKP